MKPVKEKGAHATAKVLMSIFCDMGSFPTVLRSDNAAEFVGEVIASLNSMLEIKHITGSAYHPQSQGQVETMHRTLNQLVRAVVDGHPENWESAIMYAQLMLRCAPMACLGGRSPYEVVTGLKPRFPRAITGAIPVEEKTVDAYVKDLIESLREVHTTVNRTTLEAIERDASTMSGRISAELMVGDTVLVRRPATVERKGPTRFQERAYPEIYVIKSKVSPTTFVVRDLVDEDRPIPFTQPLHADRLVKLDMPELTLEPGQPRHLQLREGVADVWTEYYIDRFGADGRVRLNLPDGAAQSRRWVDLTKCEYRWLS